MAKRRLSTRSNTTIRNGVYTRNLLAVILCASYLSSSAVAFQLQRLASPNFMLGISQGNHQHHGKRCLQQPWRTLLRETKEDDQETSLQSSPKSQDRWAKANEKRANHSNPTPNKYRQFNSNKNDGEPSNNQGNNNNSKGNYKGKNFDSNFHKKSYKSFNAAQQKQQKLSRELNQKLIGAENAKDLLLVLQKTPGALTSPSGGGAMNNVNFSTSIHRIARHLNQFHYNNNNQKGNNNKNNSQNDQRYSRALVLSDPRFALLLCSLSEALGGIPFDPSKKGTPDGSVMFGSREMSNIAWALAKMKIAPPMTASPLLTETNCKTVLLDTSKQLREKVLQVAKEKQQHQSNGVTVSTDEQQQAWIPTLSLLCGYLLDTIAVRTTLDDPNKVASKIPFQERANLLWALATAQRASPVVFENVITQMIDDMERQLLLPENQPGASPPPPPSNNNYNNNRNRKDEDALQPQEWSNSLWAFATAQVFGPGQVQLLQFVANTLDTRPGFREAFKPQEISNTAWGVATLLSKKDSASVTPEEEEAAVRILRHVAVVVTERADEFKTQELSNTLWAFATLGFGMSSKSVMERNMGGGGPASLNDYIVLLSDDPEEDEKLLVAATDAVLASALPRIQRFRSQELNNIAWSLARFDRRDVTTYLSAIGVQLCEPRRKVTPQDIGTTLWSLATLDFIDEDIYRGIAARLTVNGARFFKPQELSNTLWAMATAEVIPKYPDMFDTVMIPPKDRFDGPLLAIDDPVTVSFGVAAQELMRRPFEFKTQEIKDVLWSFSKIGIRHPDLFKSVAEHLVGREENREGKGRKPRVRGFGDFSPQGLGNLCWAFAKQGQLVTQASERSEVAVVSKNGRMAVYATSFLDIGEILLQRLFSAAAESALTMQDNLSTLKPQDLSNTVWAMAVLGFRHQPYLEAVDRQLGERTKAYANGKKTSMTSFKGQEMANVLWALAIFDYDIHDLDSAVAPFMIESTVGSAEGIKPASIAQAFKRQELANIAWSCAVFGIYPPDLMKYLYCGLVGVGGVGEQYDASQLNKYFADGGLQGEAIMSLIYLQLAMEQEKADSGLFLPEGFPDDWGQQSLSPGDLSDTTMELRLSTSKLQEDVSAAFHRIGFDHVDEHIITAAELLENQGMAISPRYQEVISIDIANLESQIAIEVDGPAHYVADIETVPMEGGGSHVVRGRLEYKFKMSAERHRINGPTALKNRLLEQHGWRSINIPFWEWYDLDGDKASEDAYCRQLLEKINHEI